MKWVMKYLHAVRDVLKDAYDREDAAKRQGDFIYSTNIAARNSIVLYFAPIPPLANYFSKKLFD